MKDKLRSVLRNRRIAATSFAAAAAVLLGTVLSLLSFSDTRTALRAEHERHLTDIARSTDRNIAVLLTNAREELGYTVSCCARAEQEYLESGSAAAFADFLRSLPVLRSEYVSLLLVMRGGDTLFSTSETAEGTFSFPYGIGEAEPCLCTDGQTGKTYFAIVNSSPRCDLRYAALIDLDRFYRSAAGSELTADYLLLLYDEGTGIVLQNDRSRPQVLRPAPEEALARGDGISVLMRSEQAQRALTESYVRPEEKASAGRRARERLISALPTTLNDNGVFAIGVSVDIAHLTELLRTVFWRLLLCGVLIFSGVALLLLMLDRGRRSSAEIRRQARELFEQNEAMQTLLRQSQELAHHQRLELIGTMTSGIAHEFNNLLTPIMGYSILSMEKLPEGSDELLDDLTEIYEASGRAKKLVSRLSALARKSSRTELTQFSPDTLLDKVLDMARPSQPQAVTVVRELRCPEKCLYANETQLAQLLLNLIINAFQAMGAQGGTLTVSTLHEAGQVVFCVRDTGPGIPPEALPQLFEPFFTTKEPGRGTGLGLAIARQIAEEHGGSIRAESGPDRGTVFTVTLPENRPK